MSKTHNKMKVFAVVLLFCAGGAFSDDADTQVKAKWTKALEKTRSVLLVNNDCESAEFVSRLLSSLDLPGGLAPANLEANRVRLKQFIRELIRKGALESASILKNTNFMLTRVPGEEVPDGPIRSPRPGKKGSPGPDGLVLYMPFDTSPDTDVVRDESNAGNDGRVAGAQWTPNGFIGGAYHFNITNVDDRIVIPDSDSLGVQHVTMSAWVKSSRASGLPTRILDKDRRKGYSMGLGATDKSKRGLPDFHISWSAGVVSDRGVCDGCWHHVAGAYDGQVIRLFIDGVLAKKQLASTPGPLPRNHWDLCIGNSVVEYEGGTFSSFDGLIDEVRVYNRALSNKEIKSLATVTRVGAYAPAADERAARMTAAERIKGGSGDISIRYIELQMNTNGMGSLHVDCRTNSNAFIVPREGLPSKLGLLDGTHVVSLGEGQTEVLHDFASLSNIEDLFPNSTGKESFAPDKAGRGVLLKPVSLSGRKGRVVEFWYPRPASLPVTLRMAVADLESDPFCIELQFQQKRYAKLNIYFFDAKKPLGVYVSWFDAEKGSLEELIKSDLPVKGEVTYKFVCPIDDEHQITTPFFQRITGEMILRQLDVTTRFPARLGVTFTERKGQVVVKSVLEGAASKAGIKPGDVILRVNSQSITSVDAAVRITRDCKARDKLNFAISRAGNVINLPIIAE